MKDPTVRTTVNTIVKLTLVEFFLYPNSNTAATHSIVKKMILSAIVATNGRYDKPNDG